jgi:hypothetical protein
VSWELVLEFVNDNQRGRGGRSLCEPSCRSILPGAVDDPLDHGLFKSASWTLSLSSTVYTTWAIPWARRATCADAMEWLHALVSKGPTPQKLGFIYMLRGDNGASNTDPYATEEKPDNNWVTTGSHVMIVGADAKALLQAYPRDPKPDPHKPYVMWAGSPYEHLMLPVQ